MRRISSRWRGGSIVASVVLTTAATGLAPAAAVNSDGSIFADEFAGTSLNTTKWTASPPSTHAFVSIDGGIASVVSRFTELDAYIDTNPGQINFGSATSWAYELRFRVNPQFVADQTLNTAHPRETALLAGQGGDVWITLLEGSDTSKFTLGWGGFGAPTDVSNLGASAVDLNRGQFYKLVAYHRADGEMEFYLDDNLVTTRSAFLNQPSSIRVGDPWGTTAAQIDLDYLRIGAAVPVPEPAIGLAAIAGALAACSRRRQRSVE